MRRLAAPIPLAALMLVLSLAAGCGSAPETIDTSGVDELVIPTPSPQVADFVEDVDNEFLPLAPGSVWTYQETDSGSTRASARVVARVRAETHEVAGIEATVVRTIRTIRTGRITPGSGNGAQPTRRVSEQWFAQDRRGNVWLVGEDRPGHQEDWAAGVDGAEAGLAMPAEPRQGDGWALGSAGGQLVGRIEVTDLEATVTTAYDDFTHALAAEEMRDGQVEERIHVAGVGLVHTLGDDGTELDLADFSRG